MRSPAALAALPNEAGMAFPRLAVTTSGLEASVLCKTPFHRSHRPQRARRARLIALAGAALIAAAPLTQAHPSPSDASALSALPVAVSLAAPVMFLSAGAVLTVIAVQATSAGTVWVLERASDGARASLTLSGQALGALSLGAGAAVLVTAMSTGWLLSAAGQALAFIPNQLGAALLYNERISR